MRNLVHSLSLFLSEIIVFILQVLALSYGWEWSLHKVFGFSSLPFLSAAGFLIVLKVISSAFRSKANDSSGPN